VSCTVRRTPTQTGREALPNGPSARSNLRTDSRMRAARRATSGHGQRAIVDDLTIALPRARRLARLNVQLELRARSSHAASARERLYDAASSASPIVRGLRFEMGSNEAARKTSLRRASVWSRVRTEIDPIEVIRRTRARARARETQHCSAAAALSRRRSLAAAAVYGDIVAIHEHTRFCGTPVATSDANPPPVHQSYAPGPRLDRRPKGARGERTLFSLMSKDRIHRETCARKRQPPVTRADRDKALRRAACTNITSRGRHSQTR